uniref:Uncharacterized protein n=1 Tax=Rhizophora mucronata TaxID=61149 RepID=A0A2P2QUF6_RHIMU
MAFRSFSSDAEIQNYCKLQRLQESPSTQNIPIKYVDAFSDINCQMRGISVLLTFWLLKLYRLQI